MSEFVNDWIYGWVYLLLSEFVNEWICEWVDLWMSESVNLWTSEFMNEWVCASLWMREWMKFSHAERRCVDSKEGKYGKNFHFLLADLSSRGNLRPSKEMFGKFAAFVRTLFSGVFSKQEYLLFSSQLWRIERRIRVRPRSSDEAYLLLSLPWISQL